MADDIKNGSGGTVGRAATGIAVPGSSGAGQGSEGDEAYYDPYSLWGYGGGGYGSGGKTPEQAQEETQAQIGNTTANYLNRAGDLSRLGTQNLQNIKDQTEQNEKLLKSTRRQNMQSLEWQPQQQKEQSTLEALRSKAGNGLYGSGLVDLMEGMGRVDDMADNALIGAWKQNEKTAYDNWFQANEDLISDYIDQMTAIEDEFSKLYSQYWSTMSNINPLLATEENLKKAKGGESVTVGEGTDAYTLPSIAGIEPNEDLKKMLQIPERASALSPYLRSFVRPQGAVTEALKVPDTGSANRSTAANQGYLDNLGVYRRRV